MLVPWALVICEIPKNLRATAGPSARHARTGWWRLLEVCGFPPLYLAIERNRKDGARSIFFPDVQRTRLIRRLHPHNLHFQPAVLRMIVFANAISDVNQAALAQPQLGSAASHPPSHRAHSAAGPGSRRTFWS